MAEQCPNKNDLQLVFKRLRSVATNKACFDCNAKNPTWASVTYGVFICIDCSAVHRSLGVHVTFVRSTQLDTNWTWLQLRQMQLGGNANATTFFRQHNCTTTDAQQKYNSRAAQLYKEKLHQLAIQAMRLHGTKLDLGPPPKVAVSTRLHLEPQTEPTTPDEKKEEDFFKEHSSAPPGDCENEDEDPFYSFNDKMRTNGTAVLGRGEPSVDAVLGGPVEAVPDRKPTIGVRKAQSKRPGLGGKKGGLGAQKIKANFDSIERIAVYTDQLKAEVEEKMAALKSAEEEEKKMASVRLAYQDLSLQQRQEEEKLKRVDPMKAQQVERLGMGLTSRSGVSHSALSDMKVIEQESPAKLGSSSRSLYDRDNDGFDDYHFSSPSYGMYKSPGESRGLESLFSESGSRDRYASSKDWTLLEPERSQPLSSLASGLEERSERPSPSRREPPSSLTPISDEAQKKFGSAKAISSDQFFGDSSDNSWERRANLSRFEGSSSISSADYFGTGSPSNRSGVGGGGSGAHLHTPDLEEVKESVRQGVTKVAGKLSSIASGVMSSIQDRYGY